MAIVEDYAAIAAELRRLQAERRPEVVGAKQQGAPSILVPAHPMRATPAGESLYRRLVSRNRP
jgi:hypothetical protein